MAKRRRTRRKKSLKGNLSAGHRPHRKKARRRKRGFMGEIVSHEGLKKTGKAFGSGMFGGGLFAIADGFIGDDGSELLRFGAAAGIALVAGAAMDKPGVAAGVGGAYGYRMGEVIGKKVFGLGEMEDVDYADDDALEQYPDALDEDGNPMMLADDGEFYYMEEMGDAYSLSANSPYALAETFQDRDMYPRYVNASHF